MQQYAEAYRDADRALSIEPRWIKGLFRKGKALCGLKVKHSLCLCVSIRAFYPRRAALKSSFTPPEILRGLAHLSGGDGLGQLQHGSQAGAETSPDFTPHGGRRALSRWPWVWAASFTGLMIAVWCRFISGNGIQLGREFKGLRNIYNYGGSYRITL